MILPRVLKEKDVDKICIHNFYVVFAGMKIKNKKKGDF